MVALYDENGGATSPTSGDWTSVNPLVVEICM